MKLRFLKPAILRVALAAGLAASLAACGGGAGGASAPTSSGSDGVGITTQSTLSMTAGDAAFLTGTGDSFPNPMASMRWSITPIDADASAALTISANADCANHTSQTQQGTSGVAHSLWGCTATLNAPANLSRNSTYKVSLTGTDSKGNSSTSNTTVTVTVIPGSSSIPVATVSAPATVKSGSNIVGTCDATGGYTTKPGIYSYQWITTPDFFNYGSTPVAATSPTVRFVAPVVTAPTTITLTCRATDDNNRVGVTKQIITVNPLSGTDLPVLVPVISMPSAVVTPYTTVNLIGGANWIRYDGAAVEDSRPMYFNWSQTSGVPVKLVNPSYQVTTFVAPQGLATQSPMTFTLSVSDAPFVSGVSTGNVRSKDVVLQLAAATPLPMDPALTLSTDFASIVPENSFVKVQVNPVTSPASTKPIYYSWTQLSGTPVVLSASNTSTLGFLAPPNSSDTPILLTFRLSAGFSPISVSNPGVATIDVTVPVRSASVATPIQPDPVLTLSTGFANVVAQNSFVTVPVTATTSQSTTKTIYYSWKQLSGPVVDLSAANTSTLGFLAPPNANDPPIVLIFRVAADFAPITATNPGVATLDVVVPVRK